MCWSLSLSSFCLKKEESHGLLRKKKWTHEGPSIEKKEKKCGHMKVHEKKEEEKKIVMLSKEFI